MVRLTGDLRGLLGLGLVSVSALSVCQMRSIKVLGIVQEFGLCGVWFVRTEDCLDFSRRLRVGLN